MTPDEAARLEKLERKVVYLEAEVLLLLNVVVEAGERIRRSVLIPRDVAAWINSRGEDARALRTRRSSS